MSARLAATAIVCIIAGGCASEAAAPTTTLVTASTTSTTSPVSAPTTSPATSSTSTTSTTSAPPVAPNGRSYPAVSDERSELIRELIELDTALQQSDPTDPAFGDLAHTQQVLYRRIGRNPEWFGELLSQVDATRTPTIERHLLARRAIADLSSGYDPPLNAPAWEIIDPLPLNELVELYQQAEADTGIEWEYLAAINLLETGFGRIRGLSTAGAQGPMQFLPTTWAEVSDGDINDPHDAIPAAARYLVRRGGPDNMERALWGYNNSDAYVEAVSLYAAMIRDDPDELAALYQWEIHYSAAAGDLWLPVGYHYTESIVVEDYLDMAPWSAPPVAS